VGWDEFWDLDSDGPENVRGFVGDFADSSRFEFVMCADYLGLGFGMWRGGRGAWGG